MYGDWVGKRPKSKSGSPAIHDRSPELANMQMVLIGRVEYDKKGKPAYGEKYGEDNEVVRAERIKGKRNKPETNTPYRPFTADNVSLTAEKAR